MTMIYRELCLFLLGDTNSLSSSTSRAGVLTSLGIGDWGLGIGDWAQSPIPNPQSPIPNPQYSFKLFSKINQLSLIKYQL
jgi:hypothetical protein